MPQVIIDRIVDQVSTNPQLLTAVIIVGGVLAILYIVYKITSRGEKKPKIIPFWKYFTEAFLREQEIHKTNYKELYRGNLPLGKILSLATYSVKLKNINRVMEVVVLTFKPNWFSKKILVAPKSIFTFLDDGKVVIPFNVSFLDYHGVYIPAGAELDGIVNFIQEEIFKNAKDTVETVYHNSIVKIVTLNPDVAKRLVELQELAKIEEEKRKKVLTSI